MKRFVARRHRPTGVFRTFEQWIGFVVAAAVVTAVLAGATIHLATTDVGTTSVIAYGAFASCSIFPFVRATRIALVIDGGEVVVRNFFRTHRYAVQDVSKLALSEKEPALFSWVAVLHLKDGSTRTVTALQEPNRHVFTGKVDNGKTDTARQVAEANLLLHRGETGRQSAAIESHRLGNESD